MLFDPHEAAEALAALAARPPVVPPIDGCPTAELGRSPAAARVAALAAAGGLFAFHYEHRHHLPPAEDWLPPSAGSAAPTWQAGVLSEPKYQAFRHDLALASFHPGQRGKWTAHELCHGVVGFGWSPMATPFFHATAGRLAELLPVALWYFLDEVFVRRCPEHQGGGALFRASCGACERVMAPIADDPHAVERLAAGARFLDAELAAVASTRRRGRVVSHRFATLDLASDGVGYAAGHAARLDSEAFHHWIELFAVAGQGWAVDLDELAERVAVTARALVVPEALGPPLADDPATGRARWIAQDLGWRLLAVAHETEGEARSALYGMAQELAAGQQQGELDGAVARVVAAYAELADAWVLPDPQEMFALGYAIAGAPERSPAIAAGVAEGVPATAASLTDAELASFCRHDLAHPDRAALPSRLAAWLAAQGHPLADVAAFESAVVTSPPGDLADAAFGDEGVDGRVRLADGMRLVRLSLDAPAVAERVLAGGTAEVLEHERRPLDLVVGRVGSGDVAIVELSSATADALASLGEGGLAALDHEDEEALRGLGVLAPAGWREVRMNRLD